MQEFRPDLLRCFSVPDGPDLEPRDLVRQAGPAAADNRHSAVVSAEGRGANSFSGEPDAGIPFPEDIGACGAAGAFMLGITGISERCCCG